MDKNKLHYMEYYGDGDAKAFSASGLIDKLQNYEVMAVRSNVGNIVGMKKNIYAAWCHVCSSEKNNFHVHCPEGKTVSVQIDVISQMSLKPMYAV